MHPEQLSQLWQDYREDKKPSLAPTTYGREYGAILKRIAKMPPSLESGRDYRAYLLETYSPETAKRTLQAIAACTRWAIAEDLITSDPFQRIKIRLPRKTHAMPEAFTRTEAIAIMGRFQLDHPYYTPWVKALFWSGARPEELRALRWRHLDSRREFLLIKEAYPLDAARPQATKTRRVTKFPLPAKFQSLFFHLQPAPPPSPEEWIFTGLEGGPFNYANFERRQWKPTVEQLVTEGFVSYYGPQYHTRHTAITLWLQQGKSVQDVAYLTRTSPKIIQEHYAAHSRLITVPEF
jgi:integrase